MIESINNERIKKYSKLLEKKYREETNLYLISTDHLVKEALKKNLIVEIFLLNGYENTYGNVTYVNEQVMRKLTNLKTLPSVVAVVKKEEINEIKGNVILLDSLQDPGNVGTIIRSAVAFNIDTIIIGNNTVDIYNEKVLRASEGMIYNVNILNRKLPDAIKELKELGYKVLGTDVEKGKDIKNINFDKYAFVVGNEGNGIKKEIKDLCDEFIYINMNSLCESLNVGVASSIIMYELNKKNVK
ncbi:MAG: RNA methyltransferase [Bacilli bacterium]|nr:RNA methyltransferase [Bacilli bacterium]